uniref:Uncharacterized protein n=1 Tax=Glossina brevipalpis TaxID=37001 RepID=A0A1A9WR58_9MUSC
MAPRELIEVIGTGTPCTCKILSFLLIYVLKTKRTNIKRNYILDASCLITLNCTQQLFSLHRLRNEICNRARAYCVSICDRNQLKARITCRKRNKFEKRGSERNKI